MSGVWGEDVLWDVVLLRGVKKGRGLEVVQNVLIVCGLFLNGRGCRRMVCRRGTFVECGGEYVCVYDGERDGVCDGVCDGGCVGECVCVLKCDTECDEEFNNERDECKERSDRSEGNKRNKLRIGD